MSRDIQLNTPAITSVIGRPWLVPCDPPVSFDCWELVRYIRELHGISTPSVVDRMARVPSSRALFSTPPSGWIKLPSPLRLCVVRIGDKHVGVYIKSQQVIHTEIGMGARMDNVRDLEIGNSLSYWEYENA